MKKQILLKLMYIVGLFIFFSSCEPTEEPKQEEEKIEFPMNFTWDIKEYEATYSYFIYNAEGELVKIEEAPSIMDLAKPVWAIGFKPIYDDIKGLNFLSKDTLELFLEKDGVSKTFNLKYDFDDISKITPDVYDEFNDNNWGEKESFYTDKFKTKVKRFSFTFASSNGEEVKAIPSAATCSDFTGEVCFEEGLADAGINYQNSKNDTIIYFINEFVYLKE